MQHEFYLNFWAILHIRLIITFLGLGKSIAQYRARRIEECRRDKYVSWLVSIKPSLLFSVIGRCMSKEPYSEYCDTLL